MSAMKKMKEFCDKHNVDFSALEAEWNNVGRDEN